MAPDARSEQDEWASIGKRAALTLAYRLAVRRVRSATDPPRRILVVDLGKHRGLLTAAVPPRQQHWIDTYLQVVGLVGAKPDGDHMDFPISPADEAEMEAWCREHSLAGAAPILLFPGGTLHLISRRWGIDGFAAVGGALARSWQAPIIGIGGPADTALAETVVARMGVPPLSAP